MTDRENELQRLHDRVDRERRARRQAEAIAAQGMKDVWELNREIEQRVTTSTTLTDVVAAGLERAHHARLAAAADAVDEATAQLSGSGTPTPRELHSITRRLSRLRADLTAGSSMERARPSLCRAADIGDRILARWQRPAARRGQLLTIDVDGETDATVFTWSDLVAVAELLLTAVSAAGSGGLVSMSITTTRDTVVFALTTTAMPADDDDDDDGTEVRLAQARRLVEETGGSWSAGVGSASLAITAIWATPPGT